MNAEAELLLPYFTNFSQELQNLEDYFSFQKSNTSMGNLIQTSTILEYDLGGEGDLFKAPEPITEEPVVGLDPMTASISMTSCGEDAISPHALEVTDIESIQSEQLLSDVFYECKKDILAKDAIETPFSDVLDIKIPGVRTDENLVAEDKLPPEGPFQKSESSGCLSSMEWIHGAPMMPSFLDFPAAFGMRRAFSEGDIKPQIISNCGNEDRGQKLSRYRNKKLKRNFGRKIKYACRKALADSQPRIRGRFAKTEVSDITK
ncbi:zinc finger protein CONSTANS-LIKE 4-like isoform X2 [Cornus florida]|uniref:zinc finger protein CONSTANS-LIKE 4-like isoform X2 n=1 Tax=Cornus florida TaxID=4283 RepID=UPI00289DA7B0|nr:zinc finger protein CONSTANS-LIKE 4-like isoform X2 [Cornus florida]